LDEGTFDMKMYDSKILKVISITKSFAYTIHGKQYMQIFVNNFILLGKSTIVLPHLT